jgi:hypothetical protein
MEINLVELTREQQNAMLLIGGPDSSALDAIPKDIIEGLIDLDLVKRRVELTDKGDLVYDQLLNSQMS